HLAFVEGSKQVHASQECALARSARTDENEHFALRDAEIDTLQDVNGSGRVAQIRLLDAQELEHPSTCALTAAFLGRLRLLRHDRPSRWLLYYQISEELLDRVQIGEYLGRKKMRRGWPCSCASPDCP